MMASCDRCDQTADVHLVTVRNPRTGDVIATLVCLKCLSLKRRWQRDAAKTRLLSE